MSRSLLVAVLLVALSAPAAESQRLAGAGNHATPPAPVALDTTGMFQAKFAQVGDDIFIGGQPTARALRDLKARGVTTIVNLRTAEEMARVSFDEGALARELGIRYVHLPMRGTAELPYGPAAVTALAEGGGEGTAALHHRLAGEPPLGGVPDTGARGAGGHRDCAHPGDQPDGRAPDGSERAAGGVVPGAEGGGAGEAVGRKLGAGGWGLEARD